MSNFNHQLLCRLAMIRAWLGAVLQVTQIMVKRATSAVLCDLRATRRMMSLWAFQQNGYRRRQEYVFGVAQGCGGGGCREGPAYASAFSSFSSAVIHMASARSRASRSSAYFFCQTTSSSLRSS